MFGSNFIITGFGLRTAWLDVKTCNWNIRQICIKQWRSGKTHLSGSLSSKPKYFANAVWPKSDVMQCRDAKIIRWAWSFCMERFMSEAHPVLYNLEMSPPQTWFLKSCGSPVCGSPVWVAGKLEDCCDFMDSSAERRHYSTHLHSALSAFDELLGRLFLWPSFTPTPLSQTHPASLHDSLATSVWH